MKTLLQFALILALCTTASAQVVQACLTINGTPNNVTKTISLCPGNVELQLTNCSPTPGNSSHILYAWENVTTSETISEGPSNTNSVNTAGMWVGTMHFNDGVKDTISRDTVTVTFHTVATLSLTLTGTSGLFNYSAPNAIKCLLSSGTFNVVPNNLVSYAWFCNTVNPNTPLSTTTSLLLNANNTVASPYRVEAMDNNGCKSAFAFNVGVSSAPTISLNHQTINQNLANKSTIILKNDLENTGTYSWYYGYPTPNTLLVSGTNINPIYLVDGGVNLIAPLDTFPLPTSDNYYMVRFTNFLCPAQDTAFVSIIIPPSQVSLEVDNDYYCINDGLQAQVGILLSNLQIGRTYELYSGDSLITDFIATSTTENTPWGPYGPEGSEFRSAFRVDHKKFCQIAWFDFHCRALNDDGSTWTEMNDRDTLQVQNPYVSQPTFCTVTSSAPVCTTGTFTFTFHDVAAGETFSFLNKMYEGDGNDILIDVKMDTVNISHPSFPNQLYVVRYKDCQCTLFGSPTYFPQLIFNVNCVDIVLSDLDAEHSNSIKVFPTAANEVLYWENNHDQSKGVITNAIGQKVLSFDMIDKKGSVNISSIPSGNYILTIQGRNGETQHKRIVK